MVVRRTGDGMNWMVASIAASVVVTCGPLFMVESIPAVRSSPDLKRQRRQLWAVTAVALLLVGIWLGVDRVAVGAGSRSLAVSLVSATLFFAILGGFAYPILRRAAQGAAAREELETRSVAFLRAPLDVPVLLLLL